MTEKIYSFALPAASHWSLRIKKGIALTLTDMSGGSNLAMLLHNPYDLSERYNAPDTLKCQHTFKLTRGHCLYSDMGRIFCSIVEDDLGWHETICGNTNRQMVQEKYGESNYQIHRNERFQNGYDSFLIELAKYGMGISDMAGNINFFSKVCSDKLGNIQYQNGFSKKGQKIKLRFEMDTLVSMHTCPHPLNPACPYPKHSVLCELTQAEPVTNYDYCMNFCPENKRGFENNRLYEQYSL